jgi:hypothetical protein
MSLYLTDDDHEEIARWTLILVADCRVDIALAQDVRRSIARAIRAAAADDLGLIGFIRQDIAKRTSVANGSPAR